MGCASRSSISGAQGLFAARIRGGVHRQRQGSRALRVRLQGVDCHARREWRAWISVN
jgi:hypothetical protein